MSPFRPGSRLLVAFVAGLVATTVTPAGPMPAATAAGAATTVGTVGSSSSGSSSSRTSITLARPDGTEPGHTLVASIVANDDDDTFAAPAGWNRVRYDRIDDTLRQSIYVRIAGPSEPESYTWDLGAWRRIAGGITAYSGVDTAHPVDGHEATVTATPGDAVTAPGITPAVSGTLLVHFAAVNTEGALSAPAGMTERWERASPNPKNAADVLASSSDGLEADVGPGPYTATASAAGPRIAAIVALRPAGAPPPPDPEPPPPPAPGDPVLVGAGDIATCTGTGDEATAALLDKIPGTVFTLGDNVYVDGTAQEFAQCYEPNWGRHKARTAIAVAGNHDYNTPGAAQYYKYFGAAAGDATKGYYDTTVGAWHVIVLNSNCDEVGGCHAGSAQEQWLRSALTASKAECTIALWHHPGFSSATIHRSNPVYRPFWEALHEHGAEVILVGSDHVYERFGFQTPAGDADAAFGIRQFTVGTGGRSHQWFKSVLPNSEVREGGTYGVLRLTLHADSYDWKFVPEAGKKFTDSGTAACHGAPPPPPPPPPPGPVTRIDSSSDGSSSSRKSITLARPDGTEPGHVMVASLVSNDDTAGFSAPPGWKLVREDSIVDRLRQAIYVKLAGPSEPSSYRWTTSQYRRLAGGITTYSGVDVTRPVDAHDARVTTTAATAVAAPSIVTSVPDTGLVHFAAVNAEGDLTAPPGMAERWEATSPNANNDRDALISSSDGPWPAAGATGTRTATATRPGVNIGALLALRPAS